MNLKDILFLSITLFLISCSQNNENQSVTNTPVINIIEESEGQNVGLAQPIIKQQSMIDKPFKDLGDDFQEFRYSKSKGTKINLSTGTEIRIPSHAFQTLSGGEVKGAIKILYREFHSVSDIMLSGISMIFEDEGEQKDFESAGMFEIRANSNGETLELKPGKEIEVDLASYKKGNFNQYVLDEKTEKWTYLEKSKPKINQRKMDRLDEKDSILNTLKPVCEVMPEEYNDGQDVFDLNYQFEDSQDWDIFAGAMWRIEGDEALKQRFRQDRQYYNQFEIMPFDSCNTFNIALWEKQDNARVPDTSYYLANPVWKGKQLDKVRQTYRKKIYDFNNKAKALIRERKRISREADLVRSFKIRGMGIFNCDRVLDFLKMVPLAITIKFKDKIVNWWYLTQNKSIAIKYYGSDIPGFKYNPNSRNEIIAVLPDNKIGVVSSKALEEAYHSCLSDRENERHMVVDLVEQPDPVLSKRSFTKTVKSL